MEVRAITRNIRVSPRKARLVCDAVRGKDVRHAMAILQFLPQKSAPIIAKTVKSAAANAENNYDLDPETLYVKRIYADDGPQLKRGEFRARGRFNRIIKRSCHITVIVEERPEDLPASLRATRQARARQQSASAANRAARERTARTTPATTTDEKETGADGTQS
jgi:large subunit ribosomal protein L22